VLPPRSRVKYFPSSNTFTTAFSTLSAALLSPKYFNIITPANIVAVGLATNFPLCFGADPCTGSNTASLPPILAPGTTPRPPTSPAAKSESMSP